MTTHSFDKAQAGKAIKALYAWLKKEQKGGKGKKDMFESEGDDFMHLTVSLKKTQPVRKDKPVRIPIKHALYSLDEMDSCLIVKDQAERREEGGQSED